MTMMMVARIVGESLGIISEWANNEYLKNELKSGKWDDAKGGWRTFARIIYTFSEFIVFPLDKMSNMRILCKMQKTFTDLPHLILPPRDTTE